VHAGKVRYIGASTHPAWMIMEALAVSEREHLARYVSEQPPYNLLDRRIENELVPLALKHHLALIPWAPLAQGMLAGRYQANQALPEGSRGQRMGKESIYGERIRQPGLEAGDRFTQLARQFGKTPGQLGLLWCKDQPGITAPIFGPRTVEQLTDVLPVLEMTLSPEERAACDAINPPGSVVADFHNSAGWMKMKVGGSD
jgi:aryl-alcohol dehydrogenase-like predicted oxidoreductase